MPLLEEAEDGVENQETRDDRGFDIFAKHDLEQDCRLKHPWNGSPEFFERHAQRMERHIRHRFCAELFQPTASLIARQSDICMIWRLLNARLRQNLFPPSLLTQMTTVSFA